MLVYPVRFFHAAMMYVLRDVPGAFTAFRRRWDAEHEGFDFETFAGWSPAAAPTWLADSSTSLATSQPLITTNISMHVDEVHRLMSALWEEPVPNNPHTPNPHDDSSRLDLCVMSDPAVHAGPWHPDARQSWPAARVFIARLRNDTSQHHWQNDQMREWDESKAYSRFQTSIIGKSRGLQHAVAPNRQSSTLWRGGPKGTKRRVFTAPMSLVIPSVCRVLREEQLKRESRQPRDKKVSVSVLPVDGGSAYSQKPWHWRQPIIFHPMQYEFV
jgi:hypothetical protein